MRRAYDWDDPTRGLPVEREAMPFGRRHGEPVIWPWLSPLPLAVIVAWVVNGATWLWVIAMCAFLVLGAAAAIPLIVRWATKGTVDASTIEPGAYTEARIEGMLRAYDRVKPSYEDPQHPVFAELYPASTRPINPNRDADRDAALGAMIAARQRGVREFHEAFNVPIAKPSQVVRAAKRKPAEFVEVMSDDGRMWRQYANGYRTQTIRQSRSSWR